MKLNQKQIRQIRKFALNYYKNQDEVHNVGHAYETVRLAKYLARKERANVQICEIGALLHQFHPENIKIVERFLEKINVDKKFVEELIYCIECIPLDTSKKRKNWKQKLFLMLIICKFLVSQD